MNEVEAACYERRRVLAVLLGSADPPPGILRPLVCGTVVSAVLVGVELSRPWW